MILQITSRYQNGSSSFVDLGIYLYQEDALMERPNKRQKYDNNMKPLTSSIPTRQVYPSTPLPEDSRAEFQGLDDGGDVAEAHKSEDLICFGMVRVIFRGYWTF